MQWLTRILRGIEYTFYAICLTALIGGSTLVVPNSPAGRARFYTRTVEFDFAGWTLNAMAVKFSQYAIGSPFYFPISALHKIEVNYLRLMDKIFQAENQLSLIYADPAVKDPKAASASLRAELAALSARQSQLAPLAEAVLQEQISAILVELGLETLHQPLPPVAYHISPPPYHLIISPRDKIQADASISLLPDLAVDRQAELEARVDEGLNVSSLVVPVGGVGSYPTMVMRTTNIHWLTDTVAHEWIHNWLTLRPLGLNYESSPEARTMNETTASIAGGEIAAIITRLYYPELAAGYATRTINLAVDKSNQQGEPFDYRVEMHETRVHVDDLLAQGKIEAAEAYMEQRRQVFWDNGYAIRKLNQAYFAFYGAYADIPGGAAGEDPVGPAVRALRAQSESLADFLETISRMTTFKQLQDALAR